MADYIIQKAIDTKDMSARALASMADKRYDMQPKYDGCHMVVVLYSDGSFKCLSATGEKVASCDHIARALHESFNVSSPVAFCGEVWIPGVAFKDISGKFRRQYDQPYLMYAPFDLLAFGDMPLADPRPYEERAARLRSIRSDVSLVPFVSHPVKQEEEYASRLKTIGGYDGAVLHDLDAPYMVGRCRNAEVVKVKPLIELDLRVVGVEKSIGEKTGKNTGALIVKLKGDQTCKVATGMTQCEVDNIDWFVGLIVVVEALSWTEDGKLREPRFKGVRLDKINPDF